LSLWTEVIILRPIERVSCPHIELERVSSSFLAAAHCAIA
jgi:hypothetical protein